MIKVYYCPIWDMPGTNATVPTFFTTLPLLRCILLRERISVVHGHQATSTLASEAIVAASAAALGLRTVYTDHSLFGVMSDLPGLVLNRVLQATTATVDAVVCVSHTCRDNFILRTRFGSRDGSGSNSDGPGTAVVVAEDADESQQQQQILLPLSERVRVIPNAVHPLQFTPLRPNEYTKRTKDDRSVFALIDPCAYVVS